jgi:hypothetical protein
MIGIKDAKPTVLQFSIAKNINIKIYRTVILHVFCMDVKMVSHIQGET